MCRSGLPNTKSATPKRQPTAEQILALQEFMVAQRRK